MLFEKRNFLNKITVVVTGVVEVIAVAAVAALISTLSACNSTAGSNTSGSFNQHVFEEELYKTAPLKIAKNTVKNEQSGEFYHVLVAEMYQQQDQSLLAIEHYLHAAKYTENKILLETTTTLAARAGQTQKALEMAKRWVNIDTKSLQARQFLALLLLRSDKFLESAKVLDDIQSLVANDAEQAITSHQFLHQMLNLESHSSQAFKAYRAYLKNHRDQPQNNENSDIYDFQQITLAKLAIKAKQYKTVLSALKNEKSSDGLLLKAKALHQLRKTSQSVKILKPIINKKTTSDVVRFEYVRFLIYANQKNEARLELKKLVKKHPDNKDLIKSLVALNLDQKKWNEAEFFANKLLIYKDYQSDARHFLGEVFEARGANQKALLSYLQVVDGKMTTNAQKKIPELLQKEQGLAAARLWLHKQRLGEGLDLSDKVLSNIVGTQKQTKNTPKKSHKESSENIVIKTSKKLSKKRKASLYKLEADLLFASHTFDTALEFYQRAVVLDPKNTEIRYSRGLLYEKQGKLKLAEKDFLYALNIDKNDVSSLKHLKSPEMATHLIDVLQKQGQQHQAKNLLMQMKRLFPNNTKF